MRLFPAVALALAFFSSLASGQKTRFAQVGPKAKPGVNFPIKAHISGIHIRTHCGSFTNFCDDVFYADATLHGKKVDLMGSIVPIPLGDYVAKQVKSPVPGLQEIGQKYEILLRDGSIWRCTVTGFSE